MNKKLVCLFLLCSVISLGEPLQCYECKTHQDQDCYSPINQEKIQKHNCRYSHFITRNHDGAEYECVAYLERNFRTNSTGVSRHCVIKNVFDCASYARYRKHMGFIVDECNVCDDDLCNSGQKTAAVFVVMLVFVLIERFYI